MASSSLDPQIINADKRLQISSSFKQYRPRMLKDFLKDDPFSCSSSNDFRSFPRKTPSKSNATNKPSPLVLLRSGSKAAATLNRVIKAVKFFPFASVKAPMALPRSISRKLSRRASKGNETSRQVSVKVKDILRWRSFRDLAEEKSTPLDFPSPSPVRYTTATATATTLSTSTTTSCSKRSSWCDSDFTVDSPLWGGENEESSGEKESKTRRNPEEDLSFEEAEQHSPVSVLDYPFCEDEESIFPFHPTFATRKSKFLQRLEQFESLVENLGETHMDNLVSDFFKDEMAKNATFDDYKNFENTANSWINGEYEACEGQGVKDASVKEMERGLDWKEFKDEHQEMAMELEKQLLNHLLDQLLDDFVSEQ